jgi:DNA end-binding protein Ku
MPNAVWTGTLSFGLVSVPVRLFPATEAKDVRFHQYDRTGRRLRYRRVVDDDMPPPVEPADIEDITDVVSASPADPRTAMGDGDGDADGTSSPGSPVDPGALSGSTTVREVEWGDILLGRETDGGETVFVEREEIERLRPRRSASIDIEDFVELGDIDPVFFEKTYHAVPRTADDARPYALLLRAMQRSRRIGIGRFVLRTKPHLVAVRPMTDVLAVETLFFGDEVRDAARISPVDLGTVAVSERELALAEQLIDMLKADWDPDAYADTYRQELLELLASKEPARTEPHGGGAAHTTATGSRIDALMAALKDSVDAAKRDRRDPGTAERAG